MTNHTYQKTIDGDFISFTFDRSIYCTNLLSRRGRVFMGRYNILQHLIGQSVVKALQQELHHLPTKMKNDRLYFRENMKTT